MAKIREMHAPELEKLHGVVLKHFGNFRAIVLSRGCLGDTLWASGSDGGPHEREQGP